LSQFELFFSHGALKIVLNWTIFFPIPIITKHLCTKIYISKTYWRNCL